MPSERPESRDERHPARQSEGRTAPEPEEYRSSTEDRGESIGDPDVQLDVPVLNVEELDLEVEDLRARVSFQAELADMVKINVGIDAEVGRAKIEIKGVEAQAQLKARLDNVRAIFSEVLTALERDPELAQNMLRSAERDDDTTGETPRTAAGSTRPGRGGPAGEETPPDATGGEEPTLEDLGIQEEYVDGEGRVVGRAQDEAGRVVEEILDEDGSIPDAKAPLETEQEEPGHAATDAARRRAVELGLNLSRVRGTGSGGRILVRDVEDAGRNGG